DADGWRLPTEAQWEYAARAGTTQAFSNGVQDHTYHLAIDPIGWFYFNRGEWGTREVGLKQANPFGLHDMHGNVKEWVWDWLGQYPSIAQTDPTGAPPSGTWPSRAGRGALGEHGWFPDGSFYRSASRNGGGPMDRWAFTGFRLVRP
ncbi:MAG: formylglycine-generating enzyme family protein, partial [Spirochaetes bacterium]|nr:formylglycine-generating enzyme family protein [Spirochaetota bacterium]